MSVRASITHDPRAHAKGIEQVFLAASIFIYLSAYAVYQALRINLARIVISSAILLLSLLIGGPSLRRTHFS